MSEWPDQIAEFQRNWVQQQQKMLTDWLETLQSAGTAAPDNVWQQAVDVMEQQVNSALETQKRSLISLAENAENIEGAPEAVKQWAQQQEEGIKRWTDVQQQLWQVWFDMLRSGTPVAQTPGEAMMKNWQDMARRAMSVQEEWLSNWTDPWMASGSTSGKKTRQSSPQKQTAKGKDNGKKHGSG